MRHDPVLLPLTRVEPLDVRRDVDPAHVGAVVATSANAIRHAPRELIGDLREKPIFTVGARTSEIASRAGFIKIHSADGDAGALAGLIAQSIDRRTTLSYLAGVERGPSLEQRLRSLGYVVDVIPTYAAPEVSRTTDSILGTLGKSPIDVALVYSPRAGDLLARWVSNPDLAQHFEKTTFLAISKQAASAISSADVHRVRVADAPNEDALLRLLPAA
jgi:uroporphyrinogen-III synthase